MAHRKHIAYIGQFHDPNYGQDEVGEVFVTLADAAAALRHRHMSGHYQPSPVLRPNGEREDHLFPSVTHDAYILLWTLQPEHQHEFVDLPTEQSQPTLEAYADDAPGHVVWIGPRHAGRIGYFGEFIDQRAERSRREVVAAGSVVVLL